MDTPAILDAPAIKVTVGLEMTALVVDPPMVVMEVEALTRVEEALVALTIAVPVVPVEILAVVVALDAREMETEVATEVATVVVEGSLITMGVEEVVAGLTVVLTTGVEEGAWVAELDTPVTMLV